MNTQKIDFSAKRKPSRATYYSYLVLLLIFLGLIAFLAIKIWATGFIGKPQYVSRQEIITIIVYSLALFVPILLNPFMTKLKNYIKLTVVLGTICIVFVVVQSIWYSFNFNFKIFFNDVIWILILFGIDRLIYIFLDTSNPIIQKIHDKNNKVQGNIKEPKIYFVTLLISTVLFAALTVFVIIKTISNDGSYSILLSVTIPFLVLSIMEYIFRWKANRKSIILITQASTSVVIYITISIYYNIHNEKIGDILYNEVMSSDFIGMIVYGMFISWTILSYLDGIRKQN
ncbi:MAG: hypothetical protein A2Y17_01810 [Clostridiales bacterium GWF2_38_85]|nr:MAG: hypothetical protein A2Y17_01810 [Clostridiales bacterium GWF2_38_85]HBL84754.1 hypothetical protein [Clostridiales bacterium]